MLIAFGGENEPGLIFLKPPTKRFPGHKAPSKMSSISSLCCMLKGKLVPATRLRFHEHFLERKPLFHGARVELFPFSSSKNLASRLSVQM